MSKNIVAEFLQNISDEDLRFVTTRLTDRMVGDLSEVLNYISKNRNIDNFLSSSSSSIEVYDKCDQIRDQAHRECKRRNLKVYKSNKKSSAA